jgi:hypothetical protein
MRDMLMSLLAVATLAAFLGILLWKVPRPDLAAIIGISFLLVLWDLFSTHRS